MAPVMCAFDPYHEDVEVLEKLPDGRQRVRCPDCNESWVHGEAGPAAVSPQWSLRGLPTAADVSPEMLARAEELKPVFLAKQHAGLDPRVPAFWAKYQRVFSEGGLPTAAPADLLAFGNDTSGSNLGGHRQKAFRDAFTANPEYGAAQVRQVVEYLLRGTGKPLEGRLTDLVNGRLPFSFPGFKEVLLTRVLAVAHPDRFLTLLTYEQKAIAAKAVYGLTLPPQDQARIGHQIVWSNDLLRRLAGEGFLHAPHAGEFLWWAQGQV